MKRFYPALVFYKGHRIFSVELIDFPGIKGVGALESAKEQARLALKKHVSEVEDHEQLPYPTSLDTMPMRVYKATAASWALVCVDMRLSDATWQSMVDTKAALEASEKEKKNDSKSKGAKTKRRPSRSS